MSDFNIIANDIHFTAIIMLTGGMKLQRREFVRFTCMMEMKFFIVYAEEGEVAKILGNAAYSKIHNGIIRNISGGGLCFISNKDMEANDVIQCSIMLGDTNMSVKGKLLEKRFISEAFAGSLYRMLFLDMAPLAQDEIISYIFSEQRKHKKTNRL